MCNIPLESVEDGDVCVPVASRARLIPLFTPATAWPELEDVRVDEERVEDERVAGAGAI